MESFEAVKQKLLNRRLYARVSFFAYMVLLVLAVYLLLFVNSWLGLGLGAAVVAFFFLVARRQVKSYGIEMSEASVRFGAGAPLEDLHYTAENGLPMAEFNALQMLPLHDAKKALLSRNSFAGRAFGLDLAASEITMHYPARVRGKDSFRFVSGTLLTARHPANGMAGDWLLLAKGLLDPDAEQGFVEACGYRRLGAPAALEEKYTLYGHGMEPLPAPTARRVARLSQAHANVTALRLWEQGAAALVQSRFYTGRYPPRVSPDDADLQTNHLPERDDVWALFRHWAAASAPAEEPTPSLVQETPVQDKT